MNKIEFFKNNNKIKIDINSVKFLQEEIKIIRVTEEAIIILDFLNKTCHFTLKKENITLNINVLVMTYNIKNNMFILDYILESEPDVQNTIIIKK